MFAILFFVFQYFLDVLQVMFPKELKGEKRRDSRFFFYYVEIHVYDLGSLISTSILITLSAYVT